MPGGQERESRNIIVYYVYSMHDMFLCLCWICCNRMVFGILVITPSCVSRSPKRCTPCQIAATYEAGPRCWIWSEFKTGLRQHQDWSFLTTGTHRSCLFHCSLHAYSLAFSELFPDIYISWLDRLIKYHSKFMQYLSKIKHLWVCLNHGYFILKFLPVCLFN